MRYFVECSYRGSNYAGWQRQPHAVSVQQVIEEAFSTILRIDIAITGCGRTDAGVHASQYFFHFDYNGRLPERLVGRLNRYFPDDILIKNIFEVSDELHARFSAIRRSYTYHITRNKDPFNIQQVYPYPLYGRMNLSKLQSAASLLLDYDAFFPFCKTHSDAKTMECVISQSTWRIEDDQMTYHISANRFLRGMVRLVVGMCLNVAIGELEIEEVHAALQAQQFLPKSLSVPAEGLFLSSVEYPGL